MSRRDSDSEKVPAALYDRLTDTPTYAARMYKVQAWLLAAGIALASPSSKLSSADGREGKGLDVDGETGAS